MKLLLFIGLGGFIGSIGRYLMSGACQRLMGGGAALFPVGTLAVNAAGSFLIGLLAALFQERFLIAPELRIALFIGVLGGFTTFSTYSYETMSLMLDGQWRVAVANFLLSNLICLILVIAGYRLGQWL